MPRRLVLTVAASTDKVLAAAAAAYPLSAQPVTLRLARRLSAGAASYPLTAQAASFRKGLSLVAGAASFPLTGQAATLRRARVLAAGVSSFPLTGISATLRKGLTLVAGATSFPLTGQAATLKRAMKVAAAAASFPLTGQAATLTKSSSARTFTFIGSCTSTGSSLDFSALSAGSVAAGDLLVYIDGAQSGSAPSSVVPSDFTNGINGAGTTFRGMVSGKKATGGEGSITGMSGATTNSKIGLVFRPSTPFTSFSMLDTATEITTGNPASQSCDPSAETTASIVVGIADSFGGTGAFATFSPAPDGTVTTSNNDMVAGYKIYDTSPQATTIDMADLGNNWLASLYFKFT